MRKGEFIHDNPSQALLAGMQGERLTALHDSLQNRGAMRTRGGNGVLRKQERKVAGEMSRRDRLARRSAESSVTGYQGYETLHEVFESAAAEAPLKGVIVEAHNDDMSMFQLTKELTMRGVQLKVVTLTDGSARRLRHYRPEQLAKQRWQEGLDAGRLAGVAEMHRIGLPDGSLADHRDEASGFLAEASKGADFFVAPNIEDDHIDHLAALETAWQVAEGKVPVYSMDTITGTDSKGRVLVPDKYVPISPRRARREKRIYRANESQVTNLPEGQIVAVFNVLGMTKRRGTEINVDYAVGVFDPINTEKDPLAQVLDFKVR